MFVCFGCVAYIKNVVFTNKISINIIQIYLFEINNWNEKLWHLRKITDNYFCHYSAALLNRSLSGFLTVIVLSRPWQRCVMGRDSLHVSSICHLKNTQWHQSLIKTSFKWKFSHFGMTQWGEIYTVIAFMTSHGTIHKKINRDEK